MVSSRPIGGRCASTRTTTRSSSSSSSDSSSNSRRVVVVARRRVRAPGRGVSPTPDQHPPARKRSTVRSRAVADGRDSGVPPPTTTVRCFAAAVARRRRRRAREPSGARPRPGGRVTPRHVTFHCIAWRHTHNGSRIIRSATATRRARHTASCYIPLHRMASHTHNGSRIIRSATRWAAGVARASRRPRPTRRRATRARRASCVDRASRHTTRRVLRDGARNEAPLRTPPRRARARRDAPVE